MQRLYDKLQTFSDHFFVRPTLFSGYLRQEVNMYSAQLLRTMQFAEYSRHIHQIFAQRQLFHKSLYHYVFFKFENSPYRTMPLAVMALCLWKLTVLNDVRSLSRILLIRILWNFVTLLSTMMSSSSLIMVYMAPCFKELLPLNYETSLVETTSAL